MEPSPQDPAEVTREEVPAGDGFVRPLTPQQIAAGQVAMAQAFTKPEPPPLRNATFAASLHQPILIDYAGVIYRVPALGFVDGMRLYAMARVFAELRQKARLDQGAVGEVDDERDDARSLYRAVAVELVRWLRRIVRPHRLRDRIRVLREGHGVLQMDATALQMLLDHLLGLPDEIARRVPALKAGEALPPIDCLDDLGQFAAHLPAWIGKDGYPLSWRHFRLGTQTWTRDATRRALMMFQAVGMTDAEQRTQEQWLARMRLSAGVN
jgi:hypothetical protein